MRAKMLFTLTEPWGAYQSKGSLVLMFRTSVQARRVTFAPFELTFDLQIFLFQLERDLGQPEC